MGGHMSQERPETCVNSSYLLLYFTDYGSTDLIYYKYIYPIQFVLGFTGNCINLITLLSKGFRSKTNYLLASMALSDLGFLLFLLPNSLATSETLALNHGFYKAFQASKMHLITMVNWFSAASIWIVLTVTMERLVAIMMPLRARSYWKIWKLILTISFIYLISFLLTFYNHISYSVTFYSICNGTQLVSRMTPVTVALGNGSEHSWLGTYVHASLIANAVLVVAAPLCTLTAFNTCLLMSLRRQHNEMRAVMCNATISAQQRRSQNDSQSTERKITIMVVAIVSSFSICNIPSMVITVMELKLGMGYFRDLSIYSNALVATGKVTNFFLYCMASANFRKQSMRLFMSKSRLGRAMSELTTRTSQLHSSNDHSLITAKAQNTKKGMPFLGKQRTRLPTADILLVTKTDVNRNSQKGKRESNPNIAPRLRKVQDRRCSMQPEAEHLLVLDKTKYEQAISLQEMHVEEKDSFM